MESSLSSQIARIAGESVDSDTAQRLVKKLQDYITEHFYHCTDEILAGLGQMYVGDGDSKTTSTNAAKVLRNLFSLLSKSIARNNTKRHRRFGGVDLRIKTCTAENKENSISKNG